jgi:hypothetical protein
MKGKLLQLTNTNDRGILAKSAGCQFSFARFFFATQVVVLSLLLFVLAGQAAYAGSAGSNSNDLHSGPSGSSDSMNGDYNAWINRQHYFYRMPFAYARFKAQKLQLTTQQNQNNVTATDPLDPQANSDQNDDNTQTRTLRDLGPGKDPVHALSPIGFPYFQPDKQFIVNPAMFADDEVFQNTLTTLNWPISDTQFQLIDREDNQRFAELAFDPERIMWTGLNTGQMLAIAGADSIAHGAETAYNNATDAVMVGPSDSGGGGGGGGGDGGTARALINVANEHAGTPISDANVPKKTISQAVYMVQQMYTQVFVPLAILFFLPGAVITQAKALVSSGFNLRADDASSPWEGILRSTVAVFLIPTTQLIVSYSIDCGNSMAYEVSNWVDQQAILDWAHQLSYNPNHFDNAILPPPPAQNTPTQPSPSIDPMAAVAAGQWGALAQMAINTIIGNQVGADAGPGQGTEQNELEQTVTANEQQSWLSSALQSMFNATQYIFSQALIVLSYFQLAYMCYLYLLGPLAAAFFAWPTVQGRLFRTVFGNWVNAVIMLALWRFYWMVILAIMTQRLIYIQDKGGQFDVQWEIAVFTCLLGLMFYIPMNPWNFDPAQAYQAATQLGSQMMSAAANPTNPQPPTPEDGPTDVGHAMPHEQIAAFAPGGDSPPVETLAFAPDGGDSGGVTLPPVSDDSGWTTVAYDAGGNVVDDSDSGSTVVSDWGGGNGVELLAANLDGPPLSLMPEGSGDGFSFIANDNASQADLAMSYTSYGSDGEIISGGSGDSGAPLVSTSTEGGGSYGLPTPSADVGTVRLADASPPIELPEAGGIPETAPSDRSPLSEEPPRVVV